MLTADYAELSEGANPIAKSSSQKPEFTKQPQLLSVLSLLAPSMPVEMLPGPLAPAIADICERMCVNLEMVAVPSIIAASAAIGRKVSIRPKRHDTWTVPCNLWGMLIAMPGFVKSESQSQALQHLRRIELAKRGEWELERIGSENLAHLIELEISAIEAQIKSACKKTQPYDALAEKLNDKRAALAATVLHEPRMITQDATMEKLGEILLHNSNGILVARDELMGWMGMLERPGREGERQFFLESWNGDGAYTVDRIGRGTLHIPALNISMTGTTQPGPLRKYIRDATEESILADGLLQRFQMMIWPDSMPAFVNVDRQPDAAAQDRAYNVFKQLDTLDPSTFASKDEGSAMWFFHFDDPAQVIFDAWRAELEGRLRSNEFAGNSAFASHLMKYKKLMPALALIFHLIEGANTSAFSECVSEHATRLAADWCAFLEEHARKVYAEGGQTLAAHVLAEHVEDGNVEDGSSIRDLYRNNWKHLGSADAVEAAASLLETIGWVIVERHKSTGGRPPSPTVWVHPALLSKAAA